MIGQNKNLEIKYALKEIVNRYGKSVYLECRKLIALLKDYLPNERERINLVESVLRSEAVTTIVNSETVDSFAVEKCVLQIQNKCFIDKRWANQVVEWILYSLSIPYESDIILKDNIITHVDEKDKADIGTDNCTIKIIDSAIVDSSALSRSEKEQVEFVYIRYGVQNIKHSAFSGMKNLKCVYISESVKTIGRRAFSGCPKLEFIEFEHSPARSTKLLSFETNADISFSNGVFEDSPNVCLVAESQEILDYAYTNSLQYIKLSIHFFDSAPLVSKDEKSILLNRWENIMGSFIKKAKNIVNNSISCGVFQPEDVHKVRIDIKGNAYIPPGYIEINVDLLCIDRELLRNISTLTIPMGVSKVAGSFLNLKLKTLYLPPTIESLSENAFKGCDQMSIRCVENSFVRTIIKKMGRNSKVVPVEHFETHKTN